MKKEQIFELLKKVSTKFNSDINENYKHEQSENSYDKWFIRFGEDFIQGCLDKNNVNKIEKYYSEEGNAEHYNKTRLNGMIKYERTFGTLAMVTFCEITAEKYRDRIGKKNNQSLEQEILKMNWYEKASAYYFDLIGTESEIKIDNTLKQKYPWDNK